MSSAEANGHLVIDPGTTHCRVVRVEAGVAQNIELHPAATLPSSVAWMDDDRLVVGDEARRLALTHPERVEHRFFSWCGRGFDSLVTEDESASNRRRGDGGDIEIELGGTSVPSVLAVSRILTVLRRGVGEELARSPRAQVDDDDSEPQASMPPFAPPALHVMIRPHWDHNRRFGLASALKIAGLERAVMVHSTTALALAYRALRSGHEDELLLVCDFGGGACDVAVIEVRMKGVEILATVGTDEFGGDSIDACLVDWMIGEFSSENDIDLSGDASAVERMRDAARKAKHRLTDAECCEIHLPHLWADASGSKHLHRTLRRRDFEQMFSGQVDRCADLVRQVLRRARREVKDISEIVMAGGCSRVPVIQDRLEALFSRVPYLEFEDAWQVARGGLLMPLPGQVTPEIVEQSAYGMWMIEAGCEPRQIVRADAELPARVADNSEGDDARVVEFHEGDEQGGVLLGSLVFEPGTTRWGVTLSEENRLRFTINGVEVELDGALGPGASERATMLEVARGEEELAHVAMVSLERITSLREVLAVVDRQLPSLRDRLDPLVVTAIGAWQRESESAIDRGDDEAVGHGLESWTQLLDGIPTKERAILEGSATVPDPKTPTTQSKEQTSVEPDTEEEEQGQPEA